MILIKKKYIILFLNFTNEMITNGWSDLKKNINYALKGRVSKFGTVNGNTVSFGGLSELLLYCH
jgi:hypothetical protein